MVTAQRIKETSLIIQSNLKEIRVDQAEFLK